MSGHGAAIVVAYNSRPTLPACLDSIREQGEPGLAVIVVDNASADGTAAWLRAERPDVRLLPAGENLGFGRANNLAFAADAADWYALVNPDARLEPGAFAACRAALERRPDAGVVGLRHLDAHGGAQPSAFPFLGLAGLLAEAIGLDRVPGLPARWTTHRIAGFDPAREADVDWLQGSFLFLRGDVVRAVGGFDPRFFMYGEDMEWCRRMRAAGHAALYLPGPPVHHVGGASAVGQEPRLFVEAWKGRLLYFDLHRGPLARALARALAALSITLRWLACECAPARERTAPRRRMFRAAMRWVLAGQPVPSARA